MDACFDVIEELAKLRATRVVGAHVLNNRLARDFYFGANRPELVLLLFAGKYLPEPVLA